MKRVDVYVKERGALTKRIPFYRWTHRSSQILTDIDAGQMVSANEDHTVVHIRPTWWPFGRI